MSQLAVPRARPAWLTRNVLALGLVSLLTDTASEMVIPLLPAFVTLLGGGALALGWIEGSADAVASLIKLLSGGLADRIGRTRPLILAGYLLSSLARPFVAAATAPWHVLVVRVTDRVGKGVRTSPRDVLLAASVPPAQRGVAFGFHRSMDHLGAVLGPLCAVALLAWTANDLRTLFWLTAIPGALAVLAILAFVRETTPAPARPAALPRALPSRELRRFLLPLALFTLGNASDVFLLLLAGAKDTPLYGLPLLWMGLHVVKAASSTPAGHFADRCGPRAAITIGWIVYALVYTGFALVSSAWGVAALFLVYGLYHGFTEGNEKALVAHLAPAHERGTAFGWYSLTIGILALPASLLFGALWQTFGSSAAFATSACLALVALLSLWLMVPKLPRVVS